MDENGSIAGEWEDEKEKRKYFAFASIASCLTPSSPLLVDMLRGGGSQMRCLRFGERALRACCKMPLPPKSTVKGNHAATGLPAQRVKPHLASSNWLAWREWLAFGHFSFFVFPFSLLIPCEPCSSTTQHESPLLFLVPLSKIQRQPQFQAVDGSPIIEA